MVHLLLQHANTGSHAAADTLLFITHTVSIHQLDESVNHSVSTNHKLCTPSIIPDSFYIKSNIKKRIVIKYNSNLQLAKGMQYTM